jgi:hypothetical protein
MSLKEATTNNLDASDGNNLVVTRAVQGSTAAEHSAQ